MKFTKKKTLNITHPDIASEWNYSMNKSIFPDQVTSGSDRKVWWKCSKGDDHIWEAAIKERTRGRNCPVCSGRKVVKSNSLKNLYPDISAQWHPSLNGDRRPDNVTARSSQKVFWKCDKGDDHVWQSRIVDRVKGGLCPICSHRKTTFSNSLAVTHPSIAKEWHPELNKSLTPKDVVYGSLRKVWWKCNKGEDHVWKSSILTRSSGSNCPICAGKKAVTSNCLATLNPDLASQWHPSLNGELMPFMVTPGSSKAVWWKCDKGEDHVWKSSINNRTRGNSCPVCNGRKTTDSNCLAVTNPALAKEWHPTLNGVLTPFDVTVGSDKKVWWRCELGEDHTWIASVKTRSKGHGCGVCAGKTVVKSNSLSTVNPKVAKEWHPTLNGDLHPEHVTSSSSKKVWWKCENGEDHEWRRSIAARHAGSKCPFCTLTPQSRIELAISFELKAVFKEIDPRGFKTTLNETLRSIDIYIPSLNLCIEFDGHYWHKSKSKLDKIKSDLVLEAGHKLIRVREHPLIKLNTNDIICFKPYDVKKISCDILKMITTMFSLNEENEMLIQKYIINDGLMNEHMFEKYIDEILRKKSEKKSNKS